MPEKKKSDKEENKKQSKKESSSEEDIIKVNNQLESPEVPASTPPQPPVKPMAVSEERTWGMLAHLSILLNMVSGFLGMVAAIIIYFVYKDRSRFVAYHAMQSFIFQAITWLGVGLVAFTLITIGGTLAFLIIPLLCLFVGLLLLLLIPASLIYGIIGGVKVNNGEDFRYWQVGDWVRNILEPKPMP